MKLNLQIMQKFKIIGLYVKTICKHLFFAFKKIRIIFFTFLINQKIS